MLNNGKIILLKEWGMSYKSSGVRLALVSLLAFALSGCYHPPYNNFKPYNRTYIPASHGALAGTAAVAAATGPVGVGTAAGAAVGALIGLNKESKPAIVNELKKFDIQFVEYGDTLTLVV